MTMYSLQAKTVLPGVGLNEIKEATKNNNLQEVVVKNEKGLQVIYAPKLLNRITIEPDSLVQTANPKKASVTPQVGQNVSFGDIKGQVVYADYESKPKGFANRKDLDKSVHIGMAVGLAVGAAAAIGVFYATGGHGVTHSSFPVIEAILQSPAQEILFGFAGAAPGAVIGGIVGGGIYAHNHKTKPDDSKLKQLLH